MTAISRSSSSGRLPRLYSARHGELGWGGRAASGGKLPCACSVVSSNSRQTDRHLEVASGDSSATATIARSSSRRN